MMQRLMKRLMACGMCWLVFAGVAWAQTTTPRTVPAGGVVRSADGEPQTGPVALTVLWDVLGKSAEMTIDPSPVTIEPPAVNKAEIDAAVDMIAQSKSPMICILIGNSAYC